MVDTARINTIVRYPRYVDPKGDTFLLETYFVGVDPCNFSPEQILAASEDLHDTVQVVNVTHTNPVVVHVSGPRICVNNFISAGVKARQAGRVFKARFHAIPTTASDPSMKPLPRS